MSNPLCVINKNKQTTKTAVKEWDYTKRTTFPTPRNVRLMKFCYLLRLRSREKISFPGWSTDLHIRPIISTSSQQHSNRCTWSRRLSSTNPADRFKPAVEQWQHEDYRQYLTTYSDKPIFRCIFSFSEWWTSTCPCLWKTDPINKPLSCSIMMLTIGDQKGCLLGYFGDISQPSQALL